MPTKTASRPGQSLQAEERMAKWCADNVEALTRKYLMREEKSSR